MHILGLLLRIPIWEQPIEVVPQHLHVLAGGDTSSLGLFDVVFEVVSKVGLNDHIKSAPNIRVSGVIGHLFKSNAMLFWVEFAQNCEVLHQTLVLIAVKLVV